LILPSARGSPRLSAYATGIIRKAMVSNSGRRNPRLAADEELLFSHEFVGRFGTSHKTGVGHSFSTGRLLPESFGGTTQLLYEPRQFGRLQLVPRNERIPLRSLQGIHREFCR